MKGYPKKYERLLKKGEEVLWHQQGEPLMSKSAFLVSLLVLGAVVVFFIGIALFFREFRLAMPALFFLLVFLVVIYNYFIVSKAYFVATNQRIIRDTKPNSKFHISQNFYKNIHEINIDNHHGYPAILCYTMPRSIPNSKEARSAIYFPRIDNNREVLRLLQENWMPLSPYQIFVDKFQTFARKYNLEFEGFHPHGERQIMIQGEIGQMPFLFSLSELYDVKTMSISITCPNAENNYLSIRKEKALDNIGKLIGVQDLKINDKKFDDDFLLQSDNQHFFEKILDPKIQNKILDAARLLEWEISLGTKPYKGKNKRSYKKGDEDILDAHLTVENPTIQERDESNMTTLIYQCNDLVKHSSNLKIIAEHCIINTEMMIQLAQKIKAYND